MKNFELTRTHVTPYTLLDIERCELVIDGECYPENPSAFFGPLMSALQAFHAEVKPGHFHVQISLQYLNSSSTKGLRKIMVLLNDWAKGGVEVHVTWNFVEGDDVIEDLGGDLTDDLTSLRIRTQAV